MMLTSKTTPIEKRVELAKEQIAVREQVVEHLRGWLKIHDKEHA
jgi:hypothetical protein